MKKRVMLVGNPNCGKTSIFNGLTGSRQRVGNWPGVTVAQKTGLCLYEHEQFEVVDLPGVYSLAIPEQVVAKDAQITAQCVAFGDADLFINVVDACHLERQLYLTSQLLELGKPTIIALNMMDIATQRGIQIDIKALSNQLDCPVVVLQAHRQVGLDQLQQHMLTTIHAPQLKHNLISSMGPDIQHYVTRLQEYLEHHITKPKVTTYLTYRWLESPQGHSVVSSEGLVDIDILLADARYMMIHTWVSVAQRKSSDTKEFVTAKIDSIVLHRIWALPIFLLLMYGLFFLAIGVGGAVQSGFDILSKSLFVQSPEWLLTYIHAPKWLVVMISQGIGQAFTTMVTFIPVLGIMYFLLSLMESSGYMARAAFVVDRLMRAMGLPGQAFVPMIVGFGCNVPAIMAARMMQTDRDRLLTVLMNPYMSCSARLAIYAVFVAALFPTNGAVIIFSLYLIGILMAVLTGFLVRRTLLPGHAAPMILELPAYHKPSLRRLLKETRFRLRYFLTRAGRVIIPVCVVLSVLNAASMTGSGSTQQSLLAMIGQWMTPLFTPMGIGADNWPAVVSLFTGMLAKEVVIGTLNSLYAQAGHLGSVATLPLDYILSFQQALHTIYTNLLHLLLPWIYGSGATSTADPVYGALSSHFETPSAAYAYLLFVLLYIPCMSTMAAIRQEASARLMWFSIIWSLLLAYMVAVLFYQLATWGAHSQHYIVYGIGVLMLLLMLGVHWIAKSGGIRAFSAS